VNRTSARLPFHLAEWESLIIEGETLGASDQHLKQELGEEGRLLVDELRTGVRVTAQSWVGVVRFERFEVRVVPKLAGDNLGLVEMIEFATGLDALRRSSSARTLHAEGIGLLDLLALLLVEASESILRGGLLADYVEREGELPVVRGRILGDQQVLRRFGRVDRLFCRYDEHDQNVVENQLLAAALGRCSTRVTHDSVRQRVRRLLAILQEVCQADELNLEAVRGRITYHRLNEHYRDAHALAWLLLDGLGIRDVLASGKTRCFAFLIDMNRLFEMFILRLIERLLPALGARAHYQRGDRSIVLNASTNRPYARVIPDVLIKASGPGRAARIAVDAKYKLYDDRKVSSGDVYQSFVYAYAYGGAVRHVLPAALLVYPSSMRASPSLRLRIRSPQTRATAEILALGISIPDALAEIKGGTRGPATTPLIGAIQQGLGDAQQTAS
jgi:5-methylcytosine-specific restriction enzyme subunit McrC